MSLILSGTDGLSDVDGSAATPAIRGTDANTGIFFPAADTIAFAEGGAEIARFDSSGNLGIGSTPTAIGSYKVLEVNGTSGAYIALKQGGTEYGNIYNNSTDGTTISASGARSIIFQTNGAERMRIDSSGNLLVGQTTAAVETGSIVTAKNLEITRTIDSDGGALGQLSWVNNTNAGVASGTSFAKDVACIKGLMDGTGNNSGGYLTFETKADAGTRTERMRISGAGRVSINTTYADTQLNIAYNGSAVRGVDINNTVSSNQDAIYFRTNGTNVGRINTDASNTSYVTSSDYRLKENITPMTGGLSKVALLKPVTYKWKVDGSDGQGFIAHELAEVVPDCVTGEKDAVETYTDEDGNEQTRIKPQGIDTSFLVATLTAAIQEQQALITALTARITALETAP
jgi:hypothetical protein